jgi:hypothetical protein
MQLIGLVDRSQLDPGETRQNTENLPWLEIREPGKRGYFVGRSLQDWEDKLRSASASALSRSLPPDAYKGWQAGRSMLLYTHAMSEGRPAEASSAQAEVLRLLGPNAYRTVFGEPPP